MSSSTNSLQTRSRKRRHPGMSRGFQGFESAKGPMKASYSRKVSAPYSAMMSSGLTTLPSDLAILVTICVSSAPSALAHERFPARFDLGRRHQALGLVPVGQRSDHALVEQALERLLGRHHVRGRTAPCARSGRTRGAARRGRRTADVQIDRAPVGLGLGAEGLPGVVRIHEAQPVPARTGPAGHGVGVPPGGLPIGPHRRTRPNRARGPAGAEPSWEGVKSSISGSSTGRSSSRTRTVRPSSRCSSGKGSPQ